MIEINRLFCRETFRNESLPYAEEYLSCVADILDSPQVRRLDDYIQHCLITRYSHSLCVSYYSFLICRSWGLNYHAAARGGLLHDLFYDNNCVQEDFNESPWEKGMHAFSHPKQALKNAAMLTSLSRLEREIIVKHMFPLGGVSFRPECHVVSFVDKFCAVSEFFASVAIFLHNHSMKRRLKRLR